jgi:hypothetical protein
MTCKTKKKNQQISEPKKPEYGEKTPPQNEQMNKKNQNLM